MARKLSGKDYLLGLGVAALCIVLCGGFMYWKHVKLKKLGKIYGELTQSRIKDIEKLLVLSRESYSVPFPDSLDAAWVANANALIDKHPEDLELTMLKVLVLPKAPSGSVVYMDFWGKPYIYAFRPESPKGFVLYSSGPDGVDNQGAGDDITAESPVYEDSIFRDRD